MFALRFACLILLILIAAGNTFGQSCELRVLTQTERGQLIAVSRSPFDVEPAKPSQNEPQVANEDLGVDVGVVISDHANLREGPGTTNPAVHELVVLLRRIPIGPWHRVIHVKSGLEGWINGNTLRVRYTEKPRPAPVFQERETGSYENPDIEITNDSDKTLYLGVGDDDRIVIAAHSTQTISKPAGTYWFYAACPGVLPAFGERRFKIGFTYTWRFYCNNILIDLCVATHYRQDRWRRAARAFRS